MAPLNEFFERIPSGRILNRLSKDIGIIDSEMPFNVGNTLIIMFRCASDLGFCIYASGIYSIPAIIFFLIMSYYF